MIFEADQYAVLHHAEPDGAARAVIHAVLQFVAPSRRYADVIIPWQRGDNIVAIDLITGKDWGLWLKAVHWTSTSCHQL